MAKLDEFSEILQTVQDDEDKDEDDNDGYGYLEDPPQGRCRRNQAAGFSTHHWTLEQGRSRGFMMHLINPRTHCR